MLTCESCKREFEKSSMNTSSRFCYYCSRGRCPKCEEILPLLHYKQCRFMHHNEICPNCNYCKHCEAYERDVVQHHEMLNDPEYYFEPWDESDTPESRIPKKPMERYTVFPSGGHEIISVNRPQIASAETGKKYIEMDVVFRSRVSAPIGSSFRLVGDEPFAVPFSWYVSHERTTTLWEPYINEFWKYLEGCYTKAVLDKLIDDLFQEHVQPALQQEELSSKQNS